LIEKLFGLLPKESPNVKPSVKISKKVIIKNVLEGILYDNIGKTEYYTTYCQIKYCTSLFPFSHALSRYLCFIGSGNSRLEIRELSKAGLSFVKNQNDLPSFKEVMDIINSQILSKIKRNEYNIPYEGQRITEIIPYINAESYCAMLEFLRSLIIVTADPKVQIDELGKVTEETIMTKETSNKIKTLLKSFWNETQNYSKKEESPINLYFALLEMLLNIDLGNPMVHAIASACLYELVCFSPSELLANYHNKISWIESFIYSLKTETRNSMSHILGIVATENADKNNTTVIELLMKFLNILTTKDDQKKMTVEYQHGALMGIGYILGKLQLRYPMIYRDILKTSPGNENLYETLIQTVINFLDIKSQIIIIGACNSLSEICKYSKNPLDFNNNNNNNDNNDNEKGKDKENDDKICSKSLLDKLIKIFNNTKDSKIQENIIMTLAFLALGTSSLANEIIEKFFTFAENMSKNVEMLFTLGEAISIIIGGWNSTLMDKYIDISDVQFPSEGHSTQDDKIVETFLSKCLNDMLKSGRPNRCKIVCIWLLCIVKYTSKLPYIQEKLPDIHSAFSYLLADKDEFTQEVASKGIGLVYDLGNDTVKQDLVGSLVNTLSEGRKMEKVNENTQIFNNLGTTPDGSQLSTYKDLLGLASDMNQPDLIYKFMNLASHNAIWNSRRGASLGFSVIMSQARNDLLPHLPTLIPKLYRFQFDPNVKVNTAMKQVWKSLVTNPKEAVDKYFDVIIVELINGLGDRMWRTRESSCLALADLLHGRKISQLEKYLEDLWNMTFRVLDDVKESVRIAAFSACKVLTKITVSNCDPSVVSPENGQKTMNIILPFLLKKGLPSPAEEVRLFALNTVFKLCKTSGVLLKPHITEIISILLESLSSLEPQAINYLSFHTDKTQQLDNIRLNATKSSPIIEAIENCIEHIDDDVMKSLSPEICTLIRKAVGFPSKAGTARFVVSLTLRKPLIVKPYADNILKALASTQSDRNMTIRKLYSSSIGYVAHVASYQALSKFIKKITKQYIENDEEENRTMAAVVLKEISNHASDQIKNNCLKIVLPLAIFGSCDPDENIKNIWRDVWDDNTAGSIGAMKLYMDEITNFINDNLVSNSWRVKKQAACTLIEVTKTIESYVEKKLDVLMPTLINALSGRIWEGKESMLQAYASVLIACKNSPLLDKDSSWRAEAIKFY
ncbi:ARM repeat-containing protein, partial [Anaeromyces robustus]